MFKNVKGYTADNKGVGGGRGHGGGGKNGLPVHVGDELVVADVMVGQCPMSKVGPGLPGLGGGDGVVLDDTAEL